MKLHSLITNFVVLFSSFTVLSDVSAQQAFQLSSKFNEATFVQNKNWAGNHGFGNVFCINFPNSTDVNALAFAMYNNNSLYFSRALYNNANTTALYVVASTVPAGRSVETEIGYLEALNQKQVEANPSHFKQSRSNGLLGTSLVLTMRNSLEGGKEKVFPFTRSFAIRPDGLMGSLSVHRIFVRGSDRIELAGLRYYKTPVSAEREVEEVAELSTFVETAATSLQTCSFGLPPRL